MFIELDPQGNEIIVQPTQTGTRSAVGSGNRRGDDRRTLLFARDPVWRYFHFFLTGSVPVGLASLAASSQ